MELPTDDELLAELKRRFDENKRALSIICVMNGKLESLNQRLAESERLKSNFLTNIRNEINNPLSAIMGLAETLMSTDSPASRTARLIHLEAARLDYQLRNIFAAAEIEAGESPSMIATVGLPVMLRGIIEMHRYSAEEKHLTVNLVHRPGHEPGPFRTDPEKLELILSNLLANAIEFSPDGGTVTLEIDLQPGLLTVSVSDAGEGIHPDDQKRIFDRFVQLETGHAKSHRGHGLGLSIVKALLEWLNGTIEVRSQPGSGSTFTFSLPERHAGDGDHVYSEYGRDYLFDEEKGDIQVF